MTGKKGIRPDSFVKFLVERTELCPHSLFDLQTLYWLDTISLFDSEMGLNLPSSIESVPNCFFEALTLVRSARIKARREDNPKEQ